MSEEKLNVGGQAVIEGVMMRSPDRVAVAVRRPDGKIVLKNDPYVSYTKRHKFWNLPVIRGAVVLIESMVLGVKALTFSGDVAVEAEKKEDAPNDEQKKKKSKGNSLWLGLTVLFSFAVGLLLFFYLPLVLTDLLGVKNGIMFNLVDGVFRLIIFLLYLFAITMWKEIQRIFQYHGAEHKSIFTYEDKKELTIKNAMEYKPFHPRCGTSFLIMVMLVSIVVFMFLGRPDSIAERLIRLAFVPVIGGFSYELIKLSAKKKDNFFVKLFIAPGLWLQRITAREPDESMVEVAIVSLEASLGKDFTDDPNVILET
ncbi:MAG: DUF1385 domain-containing protein [candidate division KSB1 bacterium]|jgi:uncharacterized protein YqhQ|nr:DUF1385 domain-containing protein [candidate division KSB1 bacterium]